MSITANKIIDAAYRKIRMKSPSGHNDADALEALNDMISTWGLDFMSPCIIRENFDLTIGLRNYRIGSGGTFDTIRPLSIADVFIRDSNNYDFPVKNLSGDDWNDVYYKDSSGRPTEIYYIPEYPLGILRFNKKPDKAYVVKFEFWKNFTEFESLATAFSFPNGYKEAMIYNLAIKLAEDNAVELPITIRETAMITKNLISRMVAINRTPPKANFDFNNGHFFNIKTDE